MTGAAAPDSGARFCSGCGERLGAGARFCASCGRAVAAPPAAPTRGLREQLPGLAVLGAFLVAGLVVWVQVLQPGPATSRAPSRGGGGPAANAAAGGGDMPPDHPQVALPDEAKRFVTQLAEKAAAAPSDVAAWKSLAQVQARAAEMDPSYGAQALESWKHVQSLAPDDVDAVRGIGNVYYDQQKFDAAAEQYEQYLKLHGDDPSVRTDLATAYLYQRQVDRAVATYQEVIAARPEFLQAHFNLGLAYEAKGEREKALASLDKARELATDDDTRTRIDRVKTQLTATPVGAAAAGMANAGAQPGADAPPAAPAGAPAASGKDFPSQVEAQLRAHVILGPKIQSIEWPDPTKARVLVAEFPMQSMPEFARNLFHTRLVTIITDAKKKFAVTEPRTIEIVDAASGTTMESVTN